MLGSLIEKVHTAAVAGLVGLVGWVGFNVYKNAQKIREIYTAIRFSRKETFWVCAWETGKCLAEVTWVWVEQKLNRTCIQKGNLYHLSFCIEGKLYRLCIHPKRGPEDLSTHTFVAAPTDLHILESYIRGYQSILQPTLKNLNLKGVFCIRDDNLVPIDPGQSLVT